MAKERTVSGMRPTGPLHIGHYFGALKNWVAMQEEMESFFFVADWHALTSDYADTTRLREYVHIITLHIRPQSTRILSGKAIKCLT